MLKISVKDRAELVSQIVRSNMQSQLGRISTLLDARMWTRKDLSRLQVPAKIHKVVLIFNRDSFIFT